MKKCFVLLLLMSILLTCGVAMAEEPVAPVFEWERDLYTHWQLDENGQPINSGEHTKNEDTMLCAVCGSEVWDYGDGYGSVTNYDEKGNMLQYTDFEPDGVIPNDIRHILTYDENGVLVLDLEFINGVFFGEYVYTANAEGNAIPVTQTAYFDDGTVSTNWYDEHGNCVRSASFDADGSLAFETLSEYAQSENGWFYECKTISRFAEGDTFYEERNQYGDRTYAVNTFADGTVWLDQTYEHEYKNGVLVWSKTYVDGTLIAESFYDEEGCNVKDVEYLEDGSCIVYTYDNDGETIKSIYDANGNLVEE